MEFPALEVGEEVDSCASLAFILTAPEGSAVSEGRKGFHSSSAAVRFRETREVGVLVDLAGVEHLLRLTGSFGRNQPLAIPESGLPGESELPIVPLGVTFLDGEMLQYSGDAF